MNWSKFTMKKNVDQKQTRVPTTKQEQVTATVKKPHDTCKNPEEKRSAIVEIISTDVDKKAILDQLRKHIRILTETQSQTIKQIELQIKETQKHLLSD